MTTKFIPQVKPILERKAEIASQVENATRTYRFYSYKNEPIDLPVIRVPITLPLYRMENYRTRLQQRAWIKERNVSSDHFKTGEENDSVQKEQHKFLWELATEEKKNIAQITEILRTEGQKEPILVTHLGVVVNGNRRLAAMRELYKSDPNAFADFLQVDCMVLPPSATEDDLKEIEVKLQMTPETRLPYDWISESIAIQDLSDRGKDPETIAALMRLKDGSKVRTKLRMLTEIDIYLKDWLHQEGNYKEVLDAEQIVYELTVRFAKKEGTELEIARKLGWILLDRRGEDGRIYNYKEIVGSLLPEITGKIRDVFPNETSVTNAGDDIEVEDLELEFDLDDSQISIEQGVSNFLQNCRDNEEMQDSVIKLCDLVVEGRKQRKNGQAAFKAVNDANTKLLAVELASAEKSTYEGIRNQLKSIQSRVSVLLEELSRLEGRAVINTN